MEHLGAIIAGSTAGERKGRDQTGEAEGTEVQHDRRIWIQMPLSIITAVVHPQFFTIKFVAAIHRVRRVVFILRHAAGGFLRIQVYHSIGRDRTGKQKLDRFRILFGTIRTQHQQLHRPFHVDAMRLLRRHLGLRGKRSRQVEDNIEVIIVKGFDLVNQIPLDMLGG